MALSPHDADRRVVRGGAPSDNLSGHKVFVVDVPAVREEAEPVLVLHGFPTSSFDWQLALDVLRARRRVVLLDYPGYGFSDKPDTKYSLFAQADIVEACARELGLADVALVTHDVGDSIGGEILAREIDGTLGFHVTRRVLTNGSIYMDLVQLTDGQKFLLALPDEALPEGSGLNADGMAAGLQVTFAPESVVDPDELAAMAELVVTRRRRSHAAARSSATSRSGACTRGAGRARSNRIRRRST